MKGNLIYQSNHVKIENNLEYICSRSVKSPEDLLQSTAKSKMLFTSLEFLSGNSDVIGETDLKPL